MILYSGKQVRYLTALKTRDAELRAYSELGRDVKKDILPLFELTKSRVTKKNVDGTVYRRMSDIFETISAQDDPFILDVTDVSHLQNKEISSFLDYEDGFRKWCDFLYQFRDREIIPCVHFLLEDDGENKKQVSRILNYFSKVCVRIKLYGEHLDYVDNVISELLPIVPSDRLIVVLDAGFVHVSEYILCENKILNIIKEVRAVNAGCDLVTLLSTFPSSVKAAGYGKGENSGRFDYKEFLIWDNIRSKVDFKVVHGDYASIHPRVNNVGGGVFIPRIDYPTENEFIYKRYRRDDVVDGKAGYVRAAIEMVKDERYHDIGCWGNDMILSAAAGALPAKNPAFWISVRSNMFMTRMVHRLS